MAPSYLDNFPASLALSSTTCLYRALVTRFTDEPIQATEGNLELKLTLIKVIQKQKSDEGMLAKIILEPLLKRHLLRVQIFETRIEVNQLLAKTT